MTTNVEICNLALSHIGKPDISTLTEASTEARECNKFYDHARRTLLQRSEWTFAKRRAALAALTNDFEERWGFRYKRPNEALSILRLGSVGYFQRRFTGNWPPFEVREDSVYCNIELAVGEYIRDMEETAKFPPLFVDALGFHLATFIARPLTRSSKLTQEMRQEAQLALSLAITADAAQDAPQYTYDGNAETMDYNEARL